MLVVHEIKTVRALLLNGIFYLVAKTCIVNMTQFNGKHGCLVCTHPGSSYSCDCHVYLQNMEHLPATARSHASIMEAFQEAEATKKPVLGHSVLAPILDLVDGIPVDYMHAVLEGVS